MPPQGPVPGPFLKNHAYLNQVAVLANLARTGRTNTNLTAGPRFGISSPSPALPPSTCRKTSSKSTSSYRSGSAGLFYQPGTIKPDCPCSAKLTGKLGKRQHGLSQAEPTYGPIDSISAHWAPPPNKTKRHLLAPPIGPDMSPRHLLAGASCARHFFAASGSSCHCPMNSPMRRSSSHGSTGLSLRSLRFWWGRCSTPKEGNLWFFLDRQLPVLTIINVPDSSRWHSEYVGFPLFSL